MFENSNTDFFNQLDITTRNIIRNNKHNLHIIISTLLNKFHDGNLSKSFHMIYYILFNIIIYLAKHISVIGVVNVRELLSYYFRPIISVYPSFSDILCMEILYNFETVATLRVFDAFVILNSYELQRFSDDIDLLSRFSDGSDLPNYHKLLHKSYTDSYFILTNFRLSMASEETNICSSFKSAIHSCVSLHFTEYTLFNIYYTLFTFYRIVFYIHYI